MPLHFFFFFCFGSGLPRSYAKASWTARRSKMRPPNPSSSLLHMGSGWHLSEGSPAFPGCLLICFHTSTLPLVQSLPIPSHLGLCFLEDQIYMQVECSFTGWHTAHPHPMDPSQNSEKDTSQDKLSHSRLHTSESFLLNSVSKAQTLETILQGP